MFELMALGLITFSNGLLGHKIVRSLEHKKGHTPGNALYALFAGGVTSVGVAFGYLMAGPLFFHDAGCSFAMLTGVFFAGTCCGILLGYLSGSPRRPEVYLSSEDLKTRQGGRRINFSCEFCNKAINTFSQNAGRRVQCPQCELLTTIPSIDREDPLTDCQDQMLPVARDQLRDGLSFEVTQAKLVECGLTPERAEAVLLEMCGGWVRRCAWCGCRFHPTVLRCEECGVNVG